MGRAYDPGIGWGRGEHGILLIAARVFGLCGFVVAAPLLDVLGANPTFFVAHNVDGGSLVLFGLAVILIPAVVVADAEWAAVALDGRIAGTGPVYESDGVLLVIAMLDPALLRDGHHTVDVYRIDSTASLRPLTRR